MPWDEYLDAIFIGGSTGFKFSAVVAHTVAEAKQRGIWVHRLRVNTVRRIQDAGAIGCDSIDGTNWSRFTDRWVHQLVALQHRQELLKAPEFARIESEKR